MQYDFAEDLNQILEKGWGSHELPVRYTRGAEPRHGERLSGANKAQRIKADAIASSATRGFRQADRTSGDVYTMLKKGKEVGTIPASVKKIKKEDIERIIAGVEFDVNML